MAIVQSDANYINIDAGMNVRINGERLGRVTMLQQTLRPDGRHARIEFEFGALKALHLSCSCGLAINGVSIHEATLSYEGRPGEIALMCLSFPFATIKGIDNG